MSRVFLDVPSGVSSAIFVQGGVGNGDDQGPLLTYRRVTHDVPNTSTIAAPEDFEILSGTTNRIVPVPAHCRYIKIELNVADANAGFEFKLAASD